MAKPKIKTKEQIKPIIYAYTEPDVVANNGLTKIGYTDKQTADERVKEQTHTANVRYILHWFEPAMFKDFTWFDDHKFHAYLEKLGVYRVPDHEWFRIAPLDAKNKYYDFTRNKGVIEADDDQIQPLQYKLRTEQVQAVSMTLNYFKSHKDGEFLWNAKPRFGKTLATYELCKQMKAVKVLILTNRPAIANSWYDDYATFLRPQSGYLFVSEAEGLKKKPLVLSRKDYINKTMKVTSVEEADSMKFIEFVSLQDLKGSAYFGGDYQKLQEVYSTEWDLLVLDEAHEGIDTTKTEIALENIKHKFTLHLSGTPFKQLANDKFPSDAIFSYTYVDEQNNKNNWDSTREEVNPYEKMPRMNMFTYQMSEIIKDEIKKGIEIDGETEEYAFDLNEFFSTGNDGRFTHEADVNRFLDALTTQTKFPFSTEELRDELKHTLWLFNRVDSAKAMARKLEKHPVFQDYKVIVAAGDGKLSSDEVVESATSYQKVIDAINQYDKTITLSVGQLTTGITVPEWTGVLMLNTFKSPALYMQAAFRAQNPCEFSDGMNCYRKTDAYVFDFDPARTLTIYEQIANDLSTDTASGRGDIEQRKKHIGELLNFFPVYGEDEDGEMIALDAEKVLTVPRRIHAVEVVRRGFMSNFLFDNISAIFGAPKMVQEIIEKFEPTAEPKAKQKPVDIPDAETMHLDDDGEIELTDDYLNDKAEELFGPKIYEPTISFEDAVKKARDEKATERAELEAAKSWLKGGVKDDLVAKAKESYSAPLNKAEEKKLDTKLEHEADHKVEVLYGAHKSNQKAIDAEYDTKLNEAKTQEEVQQIKEEHKEKKEQEHKEYVAKVVNARQEFIDNAQIEVTKTFEKNEINKTKHGVEEQVRDHLRGFARTIPSFLMAYGDDNTSLVTFDKVIPDDVFKEVTSITLEEFRFLRDGADYKDENGNTKHFNGHLFDEIVFDDSVKEFLRLRKKLADYFDESQAEDIFDCIPPQKTNQIFTPKKIVKQMVDMLEEENPGCFDDDSKTFIDLYMKSGLYIAEIVKRLYNSDSMKKMYPDSADRLNHIFAKQVYGLAPTKIIYKIASNFILGFSDDIHIDQHNLREADALPYAKNGNIEELLDRLYGGGD